MLTFARAIAPLALLPACGSFECALSRESEIPGLCALGTNRDSLPDRVRRVSCAATNDGPLRIAVEEVGTGDRPRVVVMLHGVLSDRRVWRYVSGELGRDHDLLLVDLPGCGDSDKPDPASVGPDAYSPRWMAAHVLCALRARLAVRHPDDRVTLAGHSLGGAVILRMLGDPELRTRYRDVLERVDGAVMLAPFDVAIREVNPVLVEVARVTDFEVSIGDTLGVLRDRLADGVYTGCTDPTTMPWEELDRLYGILTDPARRHAAQTMIRRAAPFDDAVRPIRSEVDRIVATYCNIDVPCLILWGANDDILPVAMGHRLAGQIPDAELRVHDASKHGLLTEDPWFCIEQLRGFMAGEVDPGVLRRA